MKEYIVAIKELALGFKSTDLREEVVRCKDCKHWDGYFCHNKWWGNGYGYYPPPVKTEEGFCDWAEREEE